MNRAELYYFVDTELHGHLLDAFARMGVAYNGYLYFHAGGVTGRRISTYFHRKPSMSDSISRGIEFIKTQIRDSNASFHLEDKDYPIVSITISTKNRETNEDIILYRTSVEEDWYSYVLAVKL